MEPSFENTPLDQLDFETALSELEKTVSALEVQELPLETSLAMFERGQALARRCAELLDNAELRVRQLSGDNLTDFDA